MNCFIKFKKSLGVIKLNFLADLDSLRFRSLTEICISTMHYERSSVLGSLRFWPGSAGGAEISLLKLCG
jgi:hypothetical protein